MLTLKNLFYIISIYGLRSLETLLVIHCCIKWFEAFDAFFMSLCLRLYNLVFGKSIDMPY